MVFDIFGCDIAAQLGCADGSERNFTYQGVARRSGAYDALRECRAAYAPRLLAITAHIDRDCATRATCSTRVTNPRFTSFLQCRRVRSFKEFGRFSPGKSLGGHDHTDQQ